MASQGILDCPGGLKDQRGVRACDGTVAYDFGDPFQAASLCFVLVHEDDRAGAIGELGCGTCRNSAVRAKCRT